MEPIQCRRCNTEMELGHIPDNSYSPLPFSHEQYWFKGEPELSVLGNVKTNKLKFQVEAYRCPQCGCLEFFANRKVF